MKKITLSMWIEFIILTGIALIFGLIFYFLNLADVLDFEGSFLVTLYGFVLLFLGWILGNHIDYSYRRSSKQYSGKLPDEMKQKIFSLRFPLFTSGGIALLLSILFYYLP